MGVWLGARAVATHALSLFLFCCVWGGPRAAVSRATCAAGSVLGDVHPPLALRCGWSQVFSCVCVTRGSQWCSNAIVCVTKCPRCATSFLPSAPRFCVPSSLACQPAVGSTFRELVTMSYGNEVYTRVAPEALVGRSIKEVKNAAVVSHFWHIVPIPFCSRSFLFVKM